MNSVETNFGTIHSSHALMASNFVSLPVMNQLGTLPQFLIIGAQKCGTSWLHAGLREHPQVFMPEDKDNEIDFCKAEELAILQQRLAQQNTGQKAGDACAAWFWTRRGNDPITGQYRNIVDDIADVLGTDIKLILLVRNPVHRSISGYLHHIRHRTLDPNVGILASDPALGIVTLSRYGYHLQNWLQRFSAENMLILPAPAEADTGAIFHAVLQFLQLNQTSQTMATDRHVLPGLAKVHQHDGIWVRLDDACMQDVSWRQSVPIKLIDHVLHARLISREEIDMLTASLAEDTHWFLEQIRQHGWWHDAYAVWNQASHRH